MYTTSTLPFPPALAGIASIPGAFVVISPIRAAKHASMVAHSVNCADRRVPTRQTIDPPERGTLSSAYPMLTTIGSLIRDFEDFRLWATPVRALVLPRTVQSVFFVLFLQPGYRVFHGQCGSILPARVPQSSDGCNPAVRTHNGGIFVY